MGGQGSCCLYKPDLIPQSSNNKIDAQMLQSVKEHYQLRKLPMWGEVDPADRDIVET